MRHVRSVDAGKVRHTLVFDSPSEIGLMVVNVAMESDRLWYLSDAFKNRDMVTRREWFGRDDMRNWGDVARSFEEPWVDGVNLIGKLVRQLENVQLAAPRDIRRRPAWRDDGYGDLDLDRFSSGNSAWRGPNRREVVGRQFLTLVIDLNTGMHTTADSMFWRSAVAVAVATKLEEFGYGVEVAVIATSFDTLEPPGYTGPRIKLNDYRDMFGCRRKSIGGFDQDVSTVVWCKRAADPIDIGTLTAAVSPWFFRTVTFGSWGLIPGTRPYEWLGSVGTPKEDWLTEYASGPGERVLIQNVWTEQAASRLLRETIEQFADRN